MKYLMLVISLLVATPAFAAGRKVVSTVTKEEKAQYKEEFGETYSIKEEKGKQDNQDSLVDYVSYLRSLRVSKGSYSWIGRQITFRVGRRSGYFLLSSNCNMRTRTIAKLYNDTWRVGQYKYFTSSRGKRYACKVMRIVVR